MVIRSKDLSCGFQYHPSYYPIEAIGHSVQATDHSKANPVGEVPRIHAKLHSEFLRIQDIGADSDTADSSKSDSSRTSSESPATEPDYELEDKLDAKPDSESDDEPGNKGKYKYKDEEPDGPYDRRNFKPLGAIPDETLTSAVLSMVELPDSATCHVDNRVEGSFHHVILLSIEISEQIVKELVLKIPPAHGLPDRWQTEDEYELENEAMLMQYIRQKTDLPVPEVLNFDNTYSNVIGAPYILMSKLPGKSAWNLWFDTENEVSHMNIDDPPEDLEQKRVNFLRSLAAAMAKLDKLEFEKIGEPSFDREDNDLICWSATPQFRWHSKTRMR